MCVCVCVCVVPHVSVCHVGFVCVHVHVGLDACLYCCPAPVLYFALDYVHEIIKYHMGGLGSPDVVHVEQLLPLNCPREH